jgi:hypothetical protein
MLGLDHVRLERNGRSKPSDRGKSSPPFICDCTSGRIRSLHCSPRYTCFGTSLCRTLTVELPSQVIFTSGQQIARGKPQRYLSPESVRCPDHNIPAPVNSGGNSSHPLGLQAPFMLVTQNQAARAVIEGALVLLAVRSLQWI